MSFQGFRSITNPVFTTSPAALVAITEETLIPTLYTGIAATESYAGKAWELSAGGIWSTGLSGTLTLTPRIGLTIAGVTLGASAAITVPVSLTNMPWQIRMRITCRTLGLAGANSTFIGSGAFISASAATAFNVMFGGTLATADATIATGIWLGKTLSVAGSMTTIQATLEALN